MGLFQRHPKHRKSFSDYVSMEAEEYSLADKFLTKERVTKGFDEQHGDEVLLADVAGGVGHETVKFKEMFPEAKGTRTVQDLPLTLDTIEELPIGTEKMHIDYFTAQPIQGRLIFAWSIIIK